jgi:hypothetical protein
MDQNPGVKRDADRSGNGDRQMGIKSRGREM